MGKDYHVLIIRPAKVIAVYDTSELYPGFGLKKQRYTVYYSEIYNHVEVFCKEMGNFKLVREANRYAEKLFKTFKCDEVYLWEERVAMRIKT